MLDFQSFQQGSYLNTALLIKSFLFSWNKKCSEMFERSIIGSNHKHES